MGKLTTGEQVLAGAWAGAIAAVLSLIMRRPGALLELDLDMLGRILVITCLFGGFLGAVLGPLAAKTLLGGVPTSPAIAFTSIGTAIGFALAPAPADGESMVPALLSPLVGLLVAAISLWGWHGMRRSLEARTPGDAP